MFEDVAGARRGRCEPFGIRMRGLLADGDVQMRDVMRMEELKIPPWQLILPTTDMTLSDMKEEETVPDVFRAAALERISSYAGCII